MDWLLEPFFNALDADEEERHLETLLAEKSRPLIQKIVARNLGYGCADADDVCSEVQMELMVRLRDLKAGSAGDPIRSYENYVGMAAHNACHRYLRRKRPQRWRLRNRLRYVFNHDPRYAIWETAARVWWCGAIAWKGLAALGTVPQPAQLEGDAKLPPAELLRRIFALSRGPLEFDSVVDLSAEIWGMPLHFGEETAVLEESRDLCPTPEAILQQQQAAAHLWNEIRGLPVRQRQSLLLNLRGDGIDLFLLSGAASLRKIAEALEMSAGELAALWNRLPLEDNRIAERLGIARQQVINLRNAARKRLWNRTAGTEPISRANASS
jgi:RNA polymerase sigma factor (sigma-70 family)